MLELILQLCCCILSYNSFSSRHTCMKFSVSIDSHRSSRIQNFSDFEFSIYSQYSHFKKIFIILQLMLLHFFKNFKLKLFSIILAIYREEYQLEKIVIRLRTSLHVMGVTVRG